MMYKIKFLYILFLLVSVGIFNSCSEFFILSHTTHHSEPKQEFEISVPTQKLEDNKYGTYLAGRVAHIRQNYDLAADYYIKSLNLGLERTDVLSSTYLLLASEGRIDEAAAYALKAREQGDTSNLIAFILMAQSMKQNDFDGALKSLSELKDSPLNNAVIPLFEAWILTASFKETETIQKLDVLKKDKALLSLYHLHKGMIYDYLGDSDKAFDEFETLINDEQLPLSFRSLQVVGNFYLRYGHKDKIVEIAQKYFTQNNETPMLKDLVESFEKADPAQVNKLIDSPQKGLAEAVFNIGTLFRGAQNEVAQLFTSLVLYLNPDFEVARVSMADLYEQAHRYSKATEEYLKIDASSPAHFVAQLKAAENYSVQKKDDKAYALLLKLLDKYPNNEQITFRLGELCRTTKKYDEAVSYYEKTLENLGDDSKSKWPVYYALGISLERQGKWNEAELIFKKALKASSRHPYILNYLGYSWIERGVNSNQALYMIFEAHRKDPTDGHIIDSVGWALYKMGKYKDAAKVLERASEYLPTNAVVFDHLGDAYWQSGRKDEARYQWQHALKASEDKEDLDEANVLQKINNGMEKAKPIIFDEKLLNDRLNTLNGKAQ